MSEVNNKLNTAVNADWKSDFFGAALTMSWQLAIVIIVPILGGYELDEKLKILPLLTIIGFIVAMVGMAVVMRAQLQRFSPTTPKATLRIKDDKNGDHK